jgi:hypothetical protein
MMKRLLAGINKFQSRPRMQRLLLLILRRNGK